MENILVVDDEKEITDIISRMLKKWGYNPVQAHSGPDALEKLKNMPIDLVITDLMMPEMDGMTLLGEILKQNDNMMVMMLTGFPSIETAVQAIKAGAFDYMVKPVQADELKSKVDRCIERKNLLKSKSVLKGLNWALIISIPFWLILGIILAKLLNN
jgi:DNA-binding NtrC family response regulator